MATFNYKAKTTNGEITSGRFDAADKNMVITLLRSKNLYPISINEVSRYNKELNISIGNSISLKDLSIFCRQFYTMINAGIAVINCLEFLRKQTENKKLAMVIGKIYESVQKGISLSESMKAYKDVFPPILSSMVEIGEVSGTLDIVLSRLAVHFEKENKIKYKIKSAMTYPMVVGCVAIVVVIFLVAFIAPKFIETLASVGGELPVPTKALMFISGLFVKPWFLLSLAAIISSSIYGFIRLKKTENGRLLISNIILKIPMIGKCIKKVLASRFTRSLSLLLKTGVPLIQALEVVGNLVNNQIVINGMVKVRDEIKRGSNLAGPLEEIGVFPNMVIQMISIGEESGTLDTTIDKVADFYDEELDSTMSQLISLIEPVMIVGLAIVIGGIVIAMIMPIFEMQKTLGKQM